MTWQWRTNGEGRDNPPSTNIFKILIRFNKHRNTLSIIQNFIPNKLIKLSVNGIETSTEVMSKQWPIVISSCDNINIVNKEVLLWKQRWIVAEDKLPCTFIDAISCCDELLFPKVFQFLKIGTTLSVTVVTCQRTMELFNVETFRIVTSTKY
ncbi:unnamed protein product [Macrosiphum euphorbiae]|uniref:Uncharacterized protein n=1 Tax=Macrosiphum euphorbiae TaxID=13131 RepID=A0AAV0VZ42_9HEMI|nr:unnamed protein product [Macrosiphum euphorbiae]